jgi:hypothetical protein
MLNSSAVAAMIASPEFHLFLLPQLNRSRGDPCIEWRVPRVANASLLLVNNNYQPSVFTQQGGIFGNQGALIPRMLDATSAAVACAATAQRLSLSTGPAPCCIRRGVRPLNAAPTCSTGLSCRKQPVVSYGFGANRCKAEPWKYLDPIEESLRTADRKAEWCGNCPGSKLRHP